MTKLTKEEQAAKRALYPSRIKRPPAYDDAAEAKKWGKFTVRRRKAMFVTSKSALYEFALTIPEDGRALFYASHDLEPPQE